MRVLSRRDFIRVAGLGAFGLSSIALAGCGQQANASDGAASKTQSLKTVRIGFTGDQGNVKLSYTPTIAYEKGILDAELEKAGYRAEYTGFPSGGPAINEAFAAKAIDIAQYGDFAAITAASKGIKLRAFTVADNAIGFAILASDSSGVQSIADLKGKTVAFPFGTNIQRYFLLALKSAGLTVSDVNAVNASGGDAPTMIASGAADASVSVFSLIYEASKKTGHIIASSVDDPSLSSTIDYFASADYLEQNRDAAVAITRALKQAWQYAKENPSEARDLLATIGVSRDEIQAEFPDDAFPQFDPQVDDDVVNKIKSVGQFMEENQLIKSSVDVDEMIDASIYQDA